MKVVVERFKDQAVTESLRDFSKRIVFEFPDLRVSYTLEVENGELRRVERGSPDQVDIKITMPSSTFVDIIDKKTSPIKEYQLGKIRVKGSMGDLIKLRKLLF